MLQWPECFSGQSKDIVSVVMQIENVSVVRAKNVLKWSESVSVVKAKTMFLVRLSPGETENIAQRYTVTTTMTPALR